MKKIYLMGIAAMMAFGLNAQHSKIVKKAEGTKRGSSAVQKNGNSMTVNTVSVTIASNNSYVSGSTMDLTFTLTSLNSDFEYIDYLELTFPAGITPTGAANTSNPFPNTEDAGGGLEALNAPSGQVISWGVDNNDAYGGIWASTGIQFIVNVTVAPGTVGAQTVNFFASGDGYPSTQGGTDGDQNGSFVINQATTPDADIMMTTVPTPDCDLSNASQVAVQIANNGATTLSNFPVAYSVNGGAPVIEMYTGTIAQGANAVYTFTTTADFSTAGTVYEVISGVSVTSDPDGANDVDTAYTMDMIPTVDTLWEDLEQQTSLLGWEFLGNNPGAWYFSGNQHTAGGAASLAFNNGATITTGVDEWVISSCVDLTAGTNYYVEFWANSPQLGVSSDGIIQTVIASDNTASAMMAGTVIGADTILPSHSAYMLHRNYFTVPTTGTYNVGFHLMPYIDTTWIRMDDIALGVDITTGIKSATVANSVNIYPNPSNGLININIAATEAVYTVIDLTGKQIAGGKVFNGNNTVDLSAFAAGTYFVRVTENGNVVTSKVTINK